MKGYKAFNSDLKCRDYQYKEGQLHVYDSTVELCVSGFHFCTELQDVVKYYYYQSMRVFEIEATGTITEPETDCSKRACSELKLIKELSLEEVKNSINKSEPAYYWACFISEQEHMKQYVTEPEWAFYWAKNIGDQEHMKQYITDSYWAYNWARDIDCNDEQYFKDKGLI